MTQHNVTEIELTAAREVVYKALQRITTPTEVLDYRHILQALYDIRSTTVGVSAHASVHAGTPHREILIVYGADQEIYVDISRIKGLIEFMGRSIDTPMKQMLSATVRAGASKAQILTYIHDVWRHDEYLIGCRPAAVPAAKDVLALKGLITNGQAVTHVEDAINGLYRKLLWLFVLSWLVPVIVGITILKYLALHA